MLPHLSRIPYFCVMDGKINRNLLFIIPKKACLDWAKKIYPKTPPEIRNQSTYQFGKAFLIPEFENHEDILAWMSKNWLTWLETMLMEWTMEEELWPNNQDWELFTEFFEVVWQPMVIDTLPLPIKKEEE